MPGTEDSASEKSLVLTGDEVHIARAALNEVLNALRPDPSFDERSGEDLLARALQELKARPNHSSLSLRLTMAERKALHAALIRTLAEFEPFEMETRMGVDRATVERLVAMVQP